MAPETVRGGIAGPASDLFSLGCVLYECLAGEPAFRGEDAMAVLYQVMNEEAVPLSKFRTDLPPEIVELVAGLMVKDPGRRFGPAAKVAEVLSGSAPLPEAGGTLAMPVPADATLLAPAPGRAPGTSPGSSATPVPGGPEASSSPAKRRVGKLFWGLGAGALLVVLAGTWMLLGRGSGPDPEARARAVRMNGLGEASLRELKPGSLDPVVLESARANFLDAIEADPTFAAPLVNLAQIHRIQGFPDSARIALEKAIELDPESSVPHNNLAAIHREAGEYEESERELKEALRLRPMNAPARLNLAEILELLGRPPDEVRMAYERAILDARTQKDDTTFLVASNNLGYFLVQSGDFALAIARLDSALVGSPEEPFYASLWKNRGLAHLGLRDQDAARSDFQESLECAPGYGPALAGLAEVAEARNEIEEAVTLWTRVSSYPDSVLQARAHASLRRLRGVD
jgi:Tfp pilus assembly protein PilF